ncbi:D-beta-hydroxybutyrate dehydrogenase, mitochondrial-like isoform X4 [Haemorhous mexicanus]|uniref:D-beta-hydroxybutyrate dehydrogenase, mitochondrial-like isoform X4 n=1 Tax=Haemorhous mexicanus TaxID=30427 RepID=UPI0028BF400B|nr:D-beta-hydroxybutyrate dehydrogenase, mitochondrial-like isoform X4 [Haemorhous mexicanus]
MRSGAGLLLALGAAGVLLLRLLLLLPRRARRALPAEGKAVLITGCDKGFGHALAKCLHAKGFTVFAGCLLMDENGDGARELRNMKSDRMKVLQMDVCSDQEVAQAVDFVKSTLKEPEEGLWGLVNNAGISTFGEVEFASLDNYKKVAEVNLWGTVRVTKAFLPLIRRAKGTCWAVGPCGEYHEHVGTHGESISLLLLRVQVWGGGVLGLPEAGDVPLGRPRHPHRAQQLRGSHRHPDGSRHRQAGRGSVERRHRHRAAGLRQRALRSPRGHHEVLREQWPEGRVSGLE